MKKIIKDKRNRTFTYLRLSITELCNFNCLYCMPNKNKKKEYLSIYNINNLLNILSALGIKKIRLTGGEPTLRKDFINIGKIIASFKNIISIVFTTNGYNLKNKIKDIVNAGFTGINISLDSLNKKNFEIITKKKYFNDIYEGINKSLDLNLEIKINIVLSNFFFLSDFIFFLSLAKYKKISIRFINQMKINKKEKNILKIYNIIEFIKTNKWKKKNKFNIDGPAIIYENNKYNGKIGIINPYSNLFCDNCNRLRISAKGNLFLCLFGNKTYNLKHFLEKTKYENFLDKILIKKVKKKLKSHDLFSNNFGKIRSFASIGG